MIATPAAVDCFVSAYESFDSFISSSDNGTWKRNHEETAAG